MGNVNIGNGETVWHADGSSPMSASQISSQQASNVAALLGRRERFDFVWASQTEMTNQLGMVQGSRGYRSDLKTEMIFDNGDWRLALPYAEFISTLTNIGTVMARPAGSFAIRTSESSDREFIQTQGDTGRLLFVNPGVYSISMAVKMEAAASARSYLEFYRLPLSDPPFWWKANIPVGEDAASVAHGSLRITAENTQVQFNIGKTTDPVNADVRVLVCVARIG